VLCGHNPNGKIVIEKTPAGYRSPNLADAVKMVFAPTPLGMLCLIQRDGTQPLPPAMAGGERGDGVRVDC
jgi:hypothetical protein